MANYTPTTENVRGCYVYSDEQYDGSLATPVTVATAEFDRWLERVKAEAKAEALEEFAGRWAAWVVDGAPQIRGGAAYRARSEAAAIRAASETEGNDHD